MSNLAPCLAGGFAVVIAMDVMAPPVGAGFIHASLMPPASFSARFDASLSSSSRYDINRTAKSSRLVPAHTGTDATNLVPKQLTAPGGLQPMREHVHEVDPAHDTEISPAMAPVGCDPAYSTLVSHAPARFAGRCLV